MSRETNWERWFGTPEKVVEYFKNRTFEYADCSMCPLEVGGRCFAYGGAVYGNDCEQRMLRWLEDDAQ